MNGRRDEPSSGVKGRKLVEGTPVVASERAPPRNGGPSDALTPAAFERTDLRKIPGAKRVCSAAIGGLRKPRRFERSATVRTKKGLARACRSAPWASEPFPPGERP